ncbi:perlucin-like protein [Mytilus galloprovincialis]|uniref:perlucin-like protein n=1 Tax=Mytilus galloprovincialis TaxID=29158 RepID=UPI003F7C2DB8
MLSFYRMFLSVILVLCCISMIETTICDRSKEKAMISEMRSLLESFENKINDNSCKCTSYSNECPAGWKKYKNHCYFFSPDTRKWHDAAKQCKNMKGYLVKITDSAENSRVVDMIKKSVKHYFGYWMGAADFQNEGHWRWVHDSSKVRFSQWLPGQPDNGGDNEHCAHFWSAHQYQWNDAPCHQHGMGYICECSHGSNCLPFNG